MSTSDHEQAATKSEPREPPSEVIELAHRLHRKINKPIGLLAKLKNLIRNIKAYIWIFITRQPCTPLGIPSVEFLAEGGYNDVWLVRPTQSDGKHATPFILRLQNDDALKPNQIQNEVGWLTWLSKNCSAIPVPKIYDYSDGTVTGKLSFVTEEYVDGTMLCDIWMAYSDDEKEIVARKIAELIVRMGDLRFEQIGGMTTAGISAPTVEGAKLFKGRDHFHRHECYNIGPYSSTEEYVLAQYDKEIYYHTHADNTMLDMGLFKKISPAKFAKQLKRERANAEAELEKEPDSGPFVLCHNDLQGRNILMRGTEIAAVIDWEFAGSYPLSELNSDDVEVVEWEAEAEEEQILYWGKRIQAELVPKIAKERGWSERCVDMLASQGREAVGMARIEMVPRDMGSPEPSSEEEEEEDGGEDEGV